ncbi:hypothetical protein C0Q70_05823 [Pomacea canaliculata]|uniref:Cadherin domain-containing protein n=1 Tax=Pomacea canaliculata TaxID=400727 RepID=A0A2T7PM85_POMCA|nr:hypothetical protein C0Q70_05823 [Pomacea canaliculata]
MVCTLVMCSPQQVEGGNLMIDLPILNVVDGDDPADVLTFVLTEQPKHGKIVRQTQEGSFPITNFTLDDITGASTIEYEHDDTETNSDLFRFFLLDGKHNVSQTVPIKIFPVFINITQGANFTQRDIDLQRVQYVHTGLEGVRDLIKLDVTDGLNPLIDRYFYVTVEGLDIVFPRVVNRGVELPEGGTAILSTDLSAELT